MNEQPPVNATEWMIILFCAASIFISVKEIIAL